ncbi:5485_t:CDS:2 [Diversispora eburnea]|uniref:5485_t:CDS:1 n=1 Tax=Diversispora eburnea TaxID=1213867 RepID=A0A9N9BAD1_9GLOM|nr:5485_t:CDS:2 [Diversispora eburnea]
MEGEFKVLVATEETDISFKAIQYAFDLCSKLKASYTLSFIYIVALNPEANVPFLHNLDRASNLDILIEAKESASKIKEYHGLVGKILKDYIENQQPDLNLLIVGSRNLDGLQKVRESFPRISSVLSIVLSSTSDYLVKNVRCPGKVHGSLARAGKVKSQTPKVEKQEKKKKKTGRAKKRIIYNRRFVNITSFGGKRRMNPAPTSSVP